MAMLRRRPVAARRVVGRSLVASAVAAALVGPHPFTPQARAGVFSSTLYDTGANQMSDTNIGINGSANYVNAVNVVGNDVPVTNSTGSVLTFNGSGTALTGTDGTSNISWNLNGAGSTFGSGGQGGGGVGNQTVTGSNIGQLFDGFQYGGNPATLQLTGLTAGQTYVVTLYNQTWATDDHDGSILRTQTITGSDGGSGSINFNEDPGAASLLKYTFQATGTTESLNFRPLSAGNTFHFYGFSTQQVFNDVWDNTDGTGNFFSGANWTGGTTLSGSMLGAPNGVGLSGEFDSASAGTVSLNGSTTVGHLQFDAPGYTLAPTTGSVLTLQTDIGGVSVLSIPQAGVVTISAPIVLNNDVAKLGPGTLMLTNSVTSNGHTINVDAGVLQLGDGSTTNASFDGNLVTSASVVFANPVAQTFTGSISGTGSVTKTGAGTLVLAGASSYGGTTVVTTGTVRASGTLSPNSPVQLTAAGALLDINGTTQTIGALSGTGTVALGNGVLSIGGDNGSATFGGTLSDSGGLSSNTGGRVAKVGNGTQILAGTNTYSGGTTINAGVLAVTSSILNTVTVGGPSASGSPTLGGTGSVTGLVTLNGAGGGAAGILQPGVPKAADPVGALTLGALTLNAGSILNYVLGAPTTAGTTYSTTNVNSALTFPSSGAVTLNLINNGGANGKGLLGAGTYRLFSAGSIANFSAASIAPGTGLQFGSIYSVSQVGNAINLNLQASAVEGIFSTSFLGSGNFDSAVGLSKSKTYVNAVQLGGPDVAVNGINFAAANQAAPFNAIAGTNGDAGNTANATSWSLTGPGNQFGAGGYTSQTTGNLGTALADFVYGTDNGGHETLSLAGLTQGQTYVLSFYENSWEAAGARISTITSADGISTVYDVDEQATAQGQLNVLRYTFLATGTTNTLTIAPNNVNNSAHLYAFTTEQVFNTTFQSGSAWTTATWNDTSPTAASSAVVPNFQGANAILPQQAGPTTIHLDANVTVGHLQFTDSTGSAGWTIDSPGSFGLTLQTDVAGVSVLNAVSGAHTISAAVTVANDVVKSGSGTLVLTGPVSASSGVKTININGGIFQANGALSNINFVDNTILTFGNASPQIFGGSIAGAGSVIMAGSSTTSLTGPGTYTGPTILQSGVLNFAAGSLGTGAVTFTGGALQYAAGNTIDVSGSVVNSTAPVVIDTNGNTVRFSLPVASTNTGGLTKVGGGSLVLGASPGSVQAYQGPTVIKGGTLQLATGPAGYYPLDGDTLDHGGNGNNGVISGAGTSFVPGKFGQALAFTGSQSVVVPNTPSLQVSGSFTVSAWFNINSNAVTSNSNGILGTRFGQDTTFDLKVNATGAAGQQSIHGDVGDGAGNWISTALDITGLTITPNTWNMVTYAISATGAHLYYNGVDVKDFTWIATPVLMTSAAGATLQIGDSSGTEFMNGAIDDVGIFTSALNAAQVQALFNAPPPVVNTLPAATPVSIAGGAVFDLNGNSQTIASLADSGVSPGGTVTNSGRSAVLTVTPAGNTSFSGTIQDGPGGPVSLIVNGTGVQALSGANTYSGGTKLMGGTLLANNTTGSASGPGVVAVGDNTGANGFRGKLAGTGSIAGPVSIFKGSTISAGNGVNTTGTLTLTSSSGNTLADGSNYFWVINDAGNATTGAGTGPGVAGGASGWDLLAFSQLTVGSAGGVDVIPTVIAAGPLPHFNSGSSYRWVILTVPAANPGGTGTTLAANFRLDAPALAAFAHSNNASASSFTVGGDATDVFISYTPAPEPSSLVLLGFGAFGLLQRRRRSRGL